jgi:hypothetical protein
MIINALNYSEIANQIDNQITKPSGDIVEYKILTQQNFLNEATDNIKNRDIINFKKPISRIKENKHWQDICDPGITLGQLSLILEEVYNLSITKIHISNNDQINELRKRITKVLQDQDNFIVANFDGKILNGLSIKQQFKELIDENLDIKLKLKNILKENEIRREESLQIKMMLNDFMIDKMFCKLTIEFLTGIIAVSSKLIGPLRLMCSI